MKKLLLLVSVIALMCAAYSLGRTHSAAGFYSTREMLEIAREHERRSVLTTLIVQRGFLDTINDIERDQRTRLSRTRYEEIMRRLIDQSEKTLDDPDCRKASDALVILRAQLVEIRRTNGQPKF